MSRHRTPLFFRALLPPFILLGASCGAEAPREFSFEATACQGCSWYKGNTHSHTTQSDGDAAPEYVIPARVSFVASRAQFTPKQVETRSAREKLPCTTCHQTSSFERIIFDHDKTKFPRRGKHASAPCSACRWTTRAPSASMRSTRSRCWAWRRNTSVRSSPSRRRH